MWAVHQTLDVLRKIFPFLTCNRTITGHDPRACLYADLGLCAAPCVGAVSQAEYRQMIADLCDFLEGRTEPIVARLEAEMRQAAEKLEFEKAARLRDQIQAIHQLVERQRVVSQSGLDSDVLALARDERNACVEVFFIRGGKLIGREYFLLENAEDTPDPDVLAAFLKQFYGQAARVPPKVLLPHDVEEAQIIREWLSDTRRTTVEISLPQNAEQEALLELAAQNAAETLAALQARQEAEAGQVTEALAALQEALGLPAPPNRIEGYDISHLHGTAAVGSMVVFAQGQPRKGHYRRFNIRTAAGDDFGSMEEVLTRRFRRWEAARALAKENAPGKQPDPSFARLPDLMLIDGGKGQLARALKVLDRFGLRERIFAVGLAKREEEIYLPGRAEPLRLPRNHPGLFLLQRVRDEAHRFAITANRNRRVREGLTSALDAIPGVGPKRKRSLLAHFGSVEAIRKASVDEIAAVPGISRGLAAVVKDALA